MGAAAEHTAQPSGTAWPEPERCLPWVLPGKRHHPQLLITTGCASSASQSHLRTPLRHGTDILTTPGTHAVLKRLLSRWSGCLFPSCAHLLAHDLARGPCAPPWLSSGPGTSISLHNEGASLARLLLHPLGTAPPCHRKPSGAQGRPFSRALGLWLLAGGSRVSCSGSSAPAPARAPVRGSFCTGGEEGPREAPGRN